MAKSTITSPKLARIDARQRHEPKPRSGISIFARAAASGTPTRHTKQGTTGLKTAAPAIRLRALKHADDSIVGRTGVRHFQSTGRAGHTNPLGRVRGVASLWKSGLDFEDTRHLAVCSRAGEDIVEGEGNGDDEHSGDDSLLEDSDVEWGDERTLIDDLMGFDDECEQNKAKRQEALTDTLREHFASLSVSIKQDLLDAVVPVIDNLAATLTSLQKGPDNDYKQVSYQDPRNGFAAFDNAANDHLTVVRNVNEEFGELKDQSLARLKLAVGKIEAERAKRTELCASFKARYAEICSTAQDRLDRLVAQDIEQAALAIESRGNAIVNGKDRNKEKMRQQILKAFA
ncbi:hypothetical protein FRC10_011190 [Ceratobasidium sp. 414]|nr:hypothetical protein FRC10_011190 [Ceratobasidium sp. 414]